MKPLRCRAHQKVLRSTKETEPLTDRVPESSQGAKWPVVSSEDRRGFGRCDRENIRLLRIAASEKRFALFSERVVSCRSEW